MILQKQHNILNLFWLSQALCNLSDTLFSDPHFLSRKTSVSITAIVSVPNFCTIRFAYLGPTPLISPEPKYFSMPKISRRHCLFPGLCLKLSAIATVHFPVSVDQKHRTNIDIQKTADHRHQILIIFHRTLQNRIAVVRILVSDPLHHRTQFKSTAFPDCRCGVLCLFTRFCFCRIDSSVIFFIFALIFCIQDFPFSQKPAGSSGSHLMPDVPLLPKSRSILPDPSACDAPDSEAPFSPSAMYQYNHLPATVQNTFPTSR